MNRKYDTLFERLVANTAEPENDQSCWTWTGPTRRHAGGRRPAVSIRVPGAGPRQFNAARLMLGLEPNDGLTASHLCQGNWLCINPDHLVAESLQDNIKRRDGHAVPLPVEALAVDDIEWWPAATQAAATCPF